MTSRRQIMDHQAARDHRATGHGKPAFANNMDMTPATGNHYSRPPRDAAKARRGRVSVSMPHGRLC